MGGLIGLVLLGLAILIVSGDLLVRGAVGLAQILRVPALLIGLTIIAFGTSAPELVVTIQAVLGGAGGIAVGNIVGSNIANVLLVLGVPALIFPIACEVKGLRRNTVIMLAATALFAGWAYLTNAIDFQAGVVLLTLIIAYLAYTGWRAASGQSDPMAGAAMLAIFIPSKSFGGIKQDISKPALWQVS